MELAGKTIKGVLVDIDGVLFVGNEAMKGAVEAIERLDVPHLYLTNTTNRSTQQLAKKLRQLGFPVENDQILSAPMAAREYLRSKGSPPARLVVDQDVLEDFEGYPQSQYDAEAIVVGDIGDEWSYPLLNEMFQLVVSGAELIALHKNKFWQTSVGLNLDIGAFIAGIEFATGKESTLIGKPSSAFFDAALQRLGVSADEAAMIGDDIDSDVGGAQASGILGVLVKTGKYRADYVERSSVEPDVVLTSIADLC